LLALTGEGYENGRGLFYSSCNLLLQRYQMAQFNRWNRRLAAGTSAISVLALGILLSFWKHYFSNYLNIMYILVREK
jgi:hypothetical protein